MTTSAADGETTTDTDTPVSEPADRERDTRRSAVRTWLVLALVLGSLVGIPAVVLAETELGLLSTVGLPRQLALGVLALVPGFALGGLSLVVMTGWRSATRR